MLSFLLPVVKLGDKTANLVTLRFKQIDRKGSTIGMTANYPDFQSNEKK